MCGIPRQTPCPLGRACAECICPRQFLDEPVDGSSWRWLFRIGTPECPVHQDNLIEDLRMAQDDERFHALYA